MRRAKSGQATVEFAIVITVFLLLVFGAIEIGRAIYERQALARGAEVIADELAQTDPENNATTWAMSASDVTTAVVHANSRASLGLNTDFSTSFAGLPSQNYQFDTTTNRCDECGPLCADNHVQLGSWRRILGTELERYRLHLFK
jgi:Flp pilus assembly protein TadG